MPTKIEGFRIFLSSTRGVYVLHQHLSDRRKQEHVLPTPRLAELTQLKVNPDDWRNCALRMRAQALVFSLHVGWKSDWRDPSLPVKPLRTLTASSYCLAKCMKWIDRIYASLGFDAAQASTTSDAAYQRKTKSATVGVDAGFPICRLCNDSLCR